MDILSRRLVIISGKGGTGKTTVCAALARLAAQGGKRVLLVEADTRADSKARITEIFGTPRIGFQPGEVSPGIWAANLDADSCMKSYVVGKVRLEMLYNAAFRFPFVRNTLHFFPGIKEFMIMYQILRLVTETDRSGRPRWDLVIFDGPTTGHSLFYLQIPKMMADILKAGPFARDAGQIHETLINEQTSCFNVVTLAEEMPVNETIELLGNAEQSMRVPLGYVFVNAIHEHALSEGRETLDALRADERGREQVAGALGGAGAVEALLECASFQTERAEINRRHIERLERQDFRSLPIPYIYSKNFDLNTIDGIARTLSHGMGGT